LLWSQGWWELYPDTDDEVAALGGLLALGHAEVREALCEGRACGAAAADGELLAVDGLDGSFPASESLFEVEVDDMLDVITFADEEWMVFLAMRSALWSV
jgi:hypothetical protein